MEIKNNILLSVDESDVDIDGKINIPERVTGIAMYAFQSVDSEFFKEVIIPKIVKKIESFSFYRCKSLETIMISNSVTKIGSKAFYGCKALKGITIPDHVTEIGSYAFWGCESLKEIMIPDSVKKIGQGAFHGCKSLKKITIPDRVTEIDSYAFCGCESLKEIAIPDSVTKIEDRAFYECTSLEKITISDNVTKIRESTFCGCASLKEITIPDRVTKIEKGAFGGCKSLKEITIPDCVTHIGNYAFDWCKKLRQITFKNQTYSVKCVDGYCMVVLCKKQMQDITILKCKYFPERKGTVYVAEKDGYAAHGKTLREAVNDLQFKMLQDANLDEHIQRIKQQGYMNANDYRLLTGACREGTNRFLQERGLTWEDTMPVSQVLEITKGQYGSEKFQTAVEQIL